MKDETNVHKDETLYLLAAERARAAHELHEGEKVERSITVLKPVSEVFQFWRDFTNLPKFMGHLESVEILSPVRSKWRWKTIAGAVLEWESEIIAEIQDRMISWQTTPGSLVNQAGSVWFRPAPQDGATEIHVQLRYNLPGGKLVKLLAEAMGQEPTQALREDLRNFKWMMEAGERPTTKGQPHGSRGMLH